MMKFLLFIASILIIRMMMLFITILKYQASEYDKKILDRAYKRHKALEYIRRKNAKKK